MTLPQTIKQELGLPFEFTRLARSSDHILQLENGLEDLDDNLGRQLRTQGPGQNITADVMLFGARMIKLRGLRKRTFLNSHENPLSGWKNSATHVQVRTRDVEVDQVTTGERSRTHGLVGLGFTVDTLDRRVDPQHFGNITLQDVRLVLLHEGFSDIGLFEEDVDHVGERLGLQKRSSVSGHRLGLMELLTLSQFDRSADHNGQDGIGVLRRRVSALLKLLREILFVTEHP